MYTTLTRRFNNLQLLDFVGSFVLSLGNGVQCFIVKYIVLNYKTRQLYTFSSYKRRTIFEIRSWFLCIGLYVDLSNVLSFPGITGVVIPVFLKQWQIVCHMHVGLQ